jgi:hypothetical protein
MYLRLHLRVLLDLQSSPTVLPSLLSHPVETMAGPSETYYGVFGVVKLCVQLPGMPNLIM